MYTLVNDISTNRYVKAIPGYLWPSSRTVDTVLIDKVIELENASKGSLSLYSIIPDEYYGGVITDIKVWSNNRPVQIESLIRLHNNTVSSKKHVVYRGIYSTDTVFSRDPTASDIPGIYYTSAIGTLKMYAVKNISPDIIKSILKKKMLMPPEIISFIKSKKLYDEFDINYDYMVGLGENYMIPWYRNRSNIIIHTIDSSRIFHSCTLRISFVAVPRYQSYVSLINRSDPLLSCYKDSAHVSFIDKTTVYNFYYKLKPVDLNTAVILHEYFISDSIREEEKLPYSEFVKNNKIFTDFMKNA